MPQADMARLLPICAAGFETTGLCKAQLEHGFELYSFFAMHDAYQQPSGRLAAELELENSGEVFFQAGIIHVTWLILRQQSKVHVRIFQNRG